MNTVKIAPLIEALLWILLAAVLYANSVKFDQEIDIYPFGAAAWPRTILLLMVIAAVGQLAWHWKGASRAPARLSAASLPRMSPRTAPRESRNFNLIEPLITAFLLALPFVYLVLPARLHAWLVNAGVLMHMETATLHTIQLGCAAILLCLYLVAMRAHRFAVLLALPIFFGALLQDIGFYLLAPFFALSVMGLMGERRRGWMALSTGIIMGLLLLFFVNLLYVGLPIGNISPFYEINAELVNRLN